MAMSISHGNEIRIPVPIEDGQRFTCTVCPHSSGHRYNFTKHVKEHLCVSIVFVCRMCSWQTGKYRHVQYHEHCKPKTTSTGAIESTDIPEAEEDARQSVEPVAACEFVLSPSPVNSCSSGSTTNSSFSTPSKSTVFDHPDFKLAIYQMSVTLDLEVHHDTPTEYVLEEKLSLAPKMLSIVETPTHIVVNSYKSETDNIVEETWASNDPDLVVYAFKFKCLSLFREICC
uniref:C2H2-type domain-containing protein n=1 Tax=Panagrellus redivivus TaxID=6233 RepID=A0A7E4VF03_PANRE